MRACTRCSRACVRRRRARSCKKIDSTLRGNTGPELRALLEALPGAFAIVCPALPSQGRTCRDGVSSVHGTPVNLLDFGRDVVSPVRDARIGAQLESPHALLPLHAVRAGARALDDEIELARARGVLIAVADAETDEDLRSLAALQQVRDDVLWVGSAGLLEMLAAEMLVDEPLANKEPVPFRHPEPVEGCATILVGSMNAMTQRQIAAFAAHPEHHLESIATDRAARRRRAGRALRRARHGGGRPRDRHDDRRRRARRGRRARAGPRARLGRARDEPPHPRSARRDRGRHRRRERRRVRRAQRRRRRAQLLRAARDPWARRCSPRSRRGSRCRARSGRICSW